MIIIGLILLSGLFFSAEAAPLSNISISLSSNRPISSADYLLNFNVATTSTLKQINIQWGRNSMDHSKPLNLSVNTVSLGQLNGLNAGIWSLGTITDSKLRLYSGAGELKSSGEAIAINLNSVINPAVGDCSVSGQNYDQCYIFITTYSDDGQTVVDTGSVAYTLESGVIANASDTLSNNISRTLNTHTLSFNLGTTRNIKQIQMQYIKAESLLSKPEHLSLFSASVTSATGIGDSTSWQQNKDLIGLGIYRLISTNGENKNSGDHISINLDSVINPEVGDCTITDSMEDTCYVLIKTFADTDGLLLVDSGIAPYVLKDQPYLSLVITGVDADTNTNGITTSVATTFNRINFGSLKIREAKFAAQKISVKSTAANGYRLNMKLDGFMQGLYPLNKIDPFDVVNVSWRNPLPWDHPTGVNDVLNTGWIGANTSDGRIDGCMGMENVWANGHGAGKFGPVSSTPHLVMCSESKDFGSDAYVTYGIEANEAQPPDSYASTIIYNITPTY